MVGMTQAEAESALREAGFAPASASQYDLTAPAGEVLAQLPEAGQEAAAGSPVGLLVSKGRPEVTVAVPDVTGMTADEAVATLADAALTAVPVEAYAADVAAGDVADQEPAPGALVTPLSEVLITVSLGEGTTTVTVPDVVGQREADAADELEAAGLVVTTVRAYSDDVAAGRVIAQAPEAGANVDEGAAAGLLVSLGALPSPSPTLPSTTAAPSPSPSEPPSEGVDPPTDPAVPTAIVPDLVGTGAAQAEAELEELGLRPVALEAPSATAPAQTVYAQLPAAGTEIPKTYPVLLLVSTGPRPAGEPARRRANEAAVRAVTDYVNTEPDWRESLEGELMAENTTGRSMPAPAARLPPEGRRGTDPVHAGHRPVPHDAGHVGHERVHRHRRRRPGHDGHRRADGDHPVHAGDGQPHGPRRQDRQHHGAQARVLHRLRHLRLRLHDDGAGAEPHRAHHRLVVPRGHRRRADHAGHRRSRRRQLPARRAPQGLRRSSPPPAPSPSPSAR